jgi:hypothetical protein
LIFTQSILYAWTTAREVNLTSRYGKAIDPACWRSRRFRDFVADKGDVEIDYFPPLLFLFIALMTFNGAAVLSPGRTGLKRFLIGLGSFEILMIPAYLWAIA